MLAELTTNTFVSGMIEAFEAKSNDLISFSDSNKFDFDQFMDGLEDDVLTDGDSAQFAAGVLYAASNQTIDKRDYIVGCSIHDDRLNNRLTNAFDAYNAGDLRTGNRKMRKIDGNFRNSMAACSETNAYFEQIDAAEVAFFNQKEWRKTARVNYDANKAYVDQQWEFCLDRWNLGVYFDAAMFYTRVTMALSGSSPLAAF